jgi:hypothetical protein
MIIPKGSRGEEQEQGKINTKQVTNNEMCFVYDDYVWENHVIGKLSLK